MSTEWLGPGTVEGFVAAIVAGGLALVAGLWLTALFATGSVPWVAGLLLAVAGLAGLAGGIFSELSV